MYDRVQWSSIQKVVVQSYRCGYCGDSVASNRGLQGQYQGRNPGAFMVICPNCTYPSFIRAGAQTPDVRTGNDVSGIDEQSVLDLYNEARDCTSVSAYTAAVLCCRKILMHVAVAKGADEGQSFVSYVDHLAEAGYIPPDGKEWVDHIRKVGNQANHEISIATRNASDELLSFVEMLLKFVYEFPHRVRSRGQESGSEQGDA